MYSTISSGAHRWRRYIYIYQKKSLESEHHPKLRPLIKKMKTKRKYKAKEYSTVRKGEKNRTIGIKTRIEDEKNSREPFPLIKKNRPDQPNNYKKGNPKKSIKSVRIETVKRGGVRVKGSPRRRRGCSRRMWGRRWRWWWGYVCCSYIASVL